MSHFGLKKRAKVPSMTTLCYPVRGQKLYVWLLKGVKTKYCKSYICLISLAKLHPFLLFNALDKIRYQIDETNQLHQGIKKSAFNCDFKLKNFGSNTVVWNGCWWRFIYTDLLQCIYLWWLRKHTSTRKKKYKKVHVWLRAMRF